MKQLLRCYEIAHDLLTARKRSRKIMKRSTNFDHVKKNEFESPHSPSNFCEDSIESPMKSVKKPEIFMNSVSKVVCKDNC